jgi:hypothetical protein
MVYIECPVNGSILSTNYILPDIDKLKEAIDRNIPVACPFCRTTHSWNDTHGFFLSQGTRSSVIGSGVEL